MIPVHIAFAGDLVVVPLPRVVVHMAVHHVGQEFFQNVVIPRYGRADFFKRSARVAVFVKSAFIHLVGVTGIVTESQGIGGEFFLDRIEEIGRIGLEPDIFHAVCDPQFLGGGQHQIQHGADIIHILLQAALFRREPTVVAAVDRESLHAHIRRHFHDQFLIFCHDPAPGGGDGCIQVEFVFVGHMSVHECQTLGCHFPLHPLQIGHIVEALADQTGGIDQVFRAV